MQNCPDITVCESWSGVYGQVRCNRHGIVCSCDYGPELYRFAQCMEQTQNQSKDQNLSENMNAESGIFC